MQQVRVRQPHFSFLDRLPSVFFALGEKANWYPARSSVGAAAGAFVNGSDVAKGFQGNLDATRIDARKRPRTTDWLGAWEAVEKQLQATASDLSQREFPLRGEGLGSLV